MNLSEKAIKEFKEIWEKEYGIAITDAQAQEYGTNLVKFFEILIDVDRRKQQ